MQVKARMTISSLIAVIASAIDYIDLAAAKSLCYYIADGKGDFLDLRNACYEQYSVGRFFAEIICTSLAAYLITFYVLKFLERKGAKIKTSNNQAVTM